jgi:hypothetical protein
MVTFGAVLFGFAVSVGIGQVVRWWQSRASGSEGDGSRVEKGREAGE